MSRKVLLILGQLGALIVGTLRSPIPRSEVSTPPAVRSLSQGQIRALRCAATMVRSMDSLFAGQRRLPKRLDSLASRLHIETLICFPSRPIWTQSPAFGAPPSKTEACKRVSCHCKVFRRLEFNSFSGIGAERSRHPQPVRDLGDGHRRFHGH